METELRRKMQQLANEYSALSAELNNNRDHTATPVDTLLLSLVFTSLVGILLITCVQNITITYKNTVYRDHSVIRRSVVERKMSRELEAERRARADVILYGVLPVVLVVIVVGFVAVRLTRLATETCDAAAAAAPPFLLLQTVLSSVGWIVPESWVECVLFSGALFFLSWLLSLSLRHLTSMVRRLGGLRRAHIRCEAVTSMILQMSRVQSIAPSQVAGLISGGKKLRN
eukprot:PhM_4_TR768/c0_g2_i1/m.39626